MSSHDVTPSNLPSLKFLREGKLEHGFTLIEMLLVIGIVGVIMAAGLSTFAQQSRFNSVKQIAAQLQNDFEELRSKTIRYNSDATFTLAANGKSYDLSIPSGTSVNPPPVTKSLPEGITIIKESGSVSTFTYSSPLSQVSATPKVYRVSFGTISVFVKVIGVTGRTVQSATN